MSALTALPHKLSEKEINSTIDIDNYIITKL